MSLRGAWTKTPGRPPAARAPAARGIAAGGLAPRPNRGRDNVALLQLLAVDGSADHPAHRLVGIGGNDGDLPEILGARLGPEDVQLVTGKQAVVRTDCDLDPLVQPVDPRDFPLDGGRAAARL